MLFVVNFFISYLLLLLTAKICKQSPKQWRLLTASALGGAYSLVILADSLRFMVTVIGKLAVSMLIVLAAFGFRRATAFLRTVAVFFFSNLLVLGFVSAVCFIFSPKGIKTSNGTVYFDISARALLLSALLSYLVSSAVIWLYNRRISSAEIYSLTVKKGDNTYRLYAFSDTGNKLTEPFSNLPVIVADRSKINEPAERLIPCETVSGSGVMEAFRPDSITVSNGKGSVVTDRVYIALSDIGSNDFSAILNPQILNK